MFSLSVYLLFALVSAADMIHHEGADVCSLPKDQGRLCTDEWQLKWFHNTATNTCEQFWYGGCDGNGNRHNTKAGCERACGASVCLLPKDEVLHYHWDSSAGRCESHSPWLCTGYGTSGNSFTSKHACYQRCGHLAGENE